MKRERCFLILLPPSRLTPAACTGNSSLVFQDKQRPAGLLQNAETETMMVQKLLPGCASSAGCTTT